MMAESAGWKRTPVVLRIEFLVRVGRVSLCARRATQAGQGQLCMPSTCLGGEEPELLEEEEEEEEESVEEEEGGEGGEVLGLLAAVGGVAPFGVPIPCDLTLVARGTLG